LTPASRNPSDGGFQVRREWWIGLSLLVCLGVYCGAWWALSERSKTRIDAWVQNLPAERASVSIGEMSRGGFPLSIRWELANVKIEALLAPGDVVADAGTISLTLDAWAPSTVRVLGNAVSATFSHRPTGLIWRLGVDTLGANAWTGREGALELTYDAGGLVFQRINAKDRAQPASRIAEAESASGTARLLPVAVGDGEARGQVVTLDLRGIKAARAEAFDLPGAGRARARVRLKGDLGDGSIEELVTWRDQSGVVEVERLAMDWAPLGFSFEGTLTLDERLRLLGAGTADVRGLVNVVDDLAGREVIKGSEATMAKLALAVLTRPAKDGGEPVVRLPLTAQHGKLRAGPFTLGRLPPLVR
jgi:hypothetical protein